MVWIDPRALRSALIILVSALFQNYERRSCKRSFFETWAALSLKSSALFYAHHEMSWVALFCAYHKMLTSRFERRTYERYLLKVWLMLVFEILNLKDLISWNYVNLSSYFRRIMIIVTLEYQINVDSTFNYSEKKLLENHKFGSCTVLISDISSGRNDRSNWFKTNFSKLESIHFSWILILSKICNPPRLLDPPHLFDTVE